MPLPRRSFDPARRVGATGLAVPIAALVAVSIRAPVEERHEAQAILPV